MKKLTLLSLSVIASILFASANSNQKAIEYFTYGLNNPAKKILLGNLKTGNMTLQEQAEACYYLGEIYSKENKVDSAGYYYQQGLSIDQSYAPNSVGEAKLILKTDVSGAEKILNGIAAKNKKDMFVQSVIAKAYLDNNLMDKASKQISDAKKANAKSALVLTVEGDMLVLKKEYGNGCNLYEQAIYFDQNYKAAYIKYARVFSTLNMSVAIDMLQRLYKIDPSSYLAYREIGEVYYQNGKFADAVKAYSKYIENEKYASEDYPKYASILFFDGDYEKSMEIIKNGLAMDPYNFVLNRLLMYNDYELKKYQEGVDLGDIFMKTPTQDFIALDYIYYARLLIENKRREDAVAQYQQAIKLDSTKISIYKDMAELYDNLKQYDNAIKCYDKFIEKGGSQVKIVDFFLLGQSYYSAVTTDSVMPKERKDEYCHVADSLFAYVAEKTPTSYLGNFWRARINSVLDPETEQGLAKPYYEATILLLNKDNARDIKPLVECYSYLGYYYYLKKDMPTSKTYWNKILEIDPRNETAIKVLKEM